MWTKWIFSISFISCIILLFILPTVRKRDKANAVTPTIMLMPLIDSLRHTLPQAQQNSLAEWKEKLYQDKSALMEKLFYFWRDSVDTFYPIISHYYQGEWGILEKSQNNITFAATFFLDRLHSSASEQGKRFFAQVASYYYDALLKMGNYTDSVRVGKAIADLYSMQPMRGVQALRRLTEENASNTYAGKYLAEALIRIGRIEQALQVLLKLVAHAPDDLQITLYLAEVYERLGKVKEAHQYYARVLSSTPQLPPHLQKVLQSKLEHLTTK